MTLHASLKLPCHFCHRVFVQSTCINIYTLWVKEGSVGDERVMGEESNTILFVSILYEIKLALKINGNKVGKSSIKEKINS